MKKLIGCVLLSIIISVIAGCHRDLPKPESKAKIVTDKDIMETHVLPVYNQHSNQIPSIYVHHQTKGNNVFVECIVTGISFRNTNETDQKTGKIVVWLDGKRTKEVTSAAFIMKNLAPGNHKIKLEVVNLQNVPYGLTNEFLVNIPK